MTHQVRPWDLRPGQRFYTRDGWRTATARPIPFISLGRRRVLVETDADRPSTWDADQARFNIVEVAP